MTREERIVAFALLPLVIVLFSCVAIREKDFSLITRDLAVTFNGLLVVVGIIQAAVFIWQLLLLRGSLEQARSASAAAEKTAQAALDANRPWIDFFTAISGPLEDHGFRRLRLQFRVRMQNKGASPATHAYVIVDLDCNNQPYPEPRRVGTFFSVFPNSDFVVDTFGILMPEDIDDALSKASAISMLNIVARVSVCYQYAGGEGRTTKYFAIDGSGPLKYIDVRKVPIPASDLGLRHRFDDAT